MSSTLDLNGATVTLTANTIYTYYQVTDTSIGHNGKLIVSEGTVLRFDNKAGSGFASAATLIEIYCNGELDNNCAIISADPNPTNLWSMPASTTLIDAKNCEFVGYTGNISADNWAYDNCLFATTRLCSVDDLASMTGSLTERVDLGRIVEYATSDIYSRLAMAGINGGGGNTLKAACIKLATAELLTRYRMDGTKMKNLILDKVTMGDDIDEAIRNLRAEATLLVSQYIKTNTNISKYRRYVRVLGRY